MLRMKVSLYKFKIINSNVLIRHKILKNQANKKKLQIVLADQVNKIINTIME